MRENLLLTTEEQAAVTRYTRGLVAIRSLPPPMRRIMQLRWMHGLKWEEISELTFYSVRQCQHYRKKAEKIIKAKV